MFWRKSVSSCWQGETGGIDIQGKTRACHQPSSVGNGFTVKLIIDVKRQQKLFFLPNNNISISAPRETRFRKELLPAFRHASASLLSSPGKAGSDWRSIEFGLFNILTAFNVNTSEINIITNNIMTNTWPASPLRKFYTEQIFVLLSLIILRLIKKSSKWITSFVNY